MSLDYDKFGHCALCHCNLMVRTLSDWKLVWRMSGKSTSMDVDMNDGSKMRVTVCKRCKSSYNHELHSEGLMESVLKGWEVECDALVADPSKPEWTPEKKAKYMEKYSKKEIVK